MKVKDIFNNITQNMLALMKNAKAKGISWTKPFSNKRYISCDGHYYRGLNTLWLSFFFKEKNPYKRKVWGTYKQWQKNGCQVPKGLKGKSIKLIRPQPFEKEMTDRDGSKVTRRWNMYLAFDVWNIEEVTGDVQKFDGFDKFDNTVNDIGKAEEFVSNTKAKIEHGMDMACYIPSKDMIRMPDKKQFINTGHSTSTENYYCTMFHELTHWTGHESRCKRNLSTRMADSKYAFEELVAELGSCFMATNLNITSNPREDHAHYLNSWIKCLEDNDDAVWKASALANKAVKWCEELQPQKEQEQEVA